MRRWPESSARTGPVAHGLDHTLHLSTGVQEGGVLPNEYGLSHLQKICSFETIKVHPRTDIPAILIGSIPYDGVKSGSHRRVDKCRNQTAVAGVDVKLGWYAISRNIESNCGNWIERIR